MLRLAFALTVPALAIAGLVGPAVLHKHQTLEPERFVSQPSTWVPYVADVRITTKTPTVEKVVLGKSFRSSDGSTRLETGELMDVPLVISIKNINGAAFYTYNQQRGWRRRPMILPPGGWHPRHVREDHPQLRHAGFHGGYEVYEQLGAGGERALVAPALNLLQLVVETRRPDYHSVTELTNIEIREPHASLFQPPPNVPIEEKPEPGGIIWSKSPPPRTRQKH